MASAAVPIRRGVGLDSMWICVEENLESSGNTRSTEITEKQPAGLQTRSRPRGPKIAVAVAVGGVGVALVV